MNDKETLFLDLYIAGGMQASKKVEAYHMAYGEEAENLTSGTIETYAKRILARQESKDYINQRRVTSSTQSFQLIEAIRQIDQIIKVSDLKPLELVQLLRERRQTISDLTKLIVVDMPSKGQSDNYIISDVSFKVDLGRLSDLEDYEIIEAIEHCGAGRFLAINDEGNLQVITVSTKKGEGTEKLAERIKKGSFRIAVEKQEVDQQ